MLPVQTKTTRQAAWRRTASSDTTPGRTTFHEPPSTWTTVAGCRSGVGPSSTITAARSPTIRTTWAASPAATSGLAASSPRARRQKHRPGQRAQRGQYSLMGRAAQPQPSLRTDFAAHRVGQPAGEAVGDALAAFQRQRTGPEAARQSAAERSHAGRPVARLGRPAASPAAAAPSGGPAFASRNRPTASGDRPLAARW